MYGTANVLHTAAWSLRRLARLSPMQAMTRELRRRGVVLAEMDGLEVFGGDGLRHTIDYYRDLRSLEAWEIDAESAAGLRRNLPGVKVANVDSFEELQKTDRTYDLAVVDNPVSLYGVDHHYCEHIELLPALLRVLRPSAIILLNVLPDLMGRTRAASSVSTQEQLRKRGQFYETKTPEAIPIEVMIHTYQRKLQDDGFRLEWHCSQLRTVRSRVYYLALKVSRIV